MGLDHLAVAFDGLGPGGAAFFRLLSAGPPRVWGRQARCILVLRARYATEDLDAALAHAARFGALEHLAVERILEARSSPRTLDEYVAEDTAQRLEQALGAQRTPSHDLPACDRLPVARASSASLAVLAEPLQEPCPCPTKWQVRRRRVTQDDFEDHDPATIQRIVRSSLDRRR